jgi:hypothetical protein
MRAAIFHVGWRGGPTPARTDISEITSMSRVSSP